MDANGDGRGRGVDDDDDDDDVHHDAEASIGETGGRRREGRRRRCERC
jgi:hypothetical protein